MGNLFLLFLSVNRHCLVGEFVGCVDPEIIPQKNIVIMDDANIIFTSLKQNHFPVSRRKSSQTNERRKNARFLFFNLIFVMLFSSLDRFRLRFSANHTDFVNVLNWRKKKTPKTIIGIGTHWRGKINCTFKHLEKINLYIDCCVYV